MSELLMPFAKLSLTGEVVAVSEVPRGKKCGCVCLFCGVSVQAKKGGRNREHFAHMPKLVNENDICPASFERCLFWMARRIFSEAQAIQVPEYVYEKYSAPYNIHCKQKITKARLIEYASVSFPNGMNNVNVDTILIDVKGHVLAISLFFGGIVDSSAYIVNGKEHAHLGIEMSKFDVLFKQHKVAFKEVMIEKLLISETGKKWLFHPRERALVEKTDSQFELQIRSVKESHIEKNKTLQKTPHKVNNYLNSSLSGEISRSRQLTKIVYQLSSWPHQKWVKSVDDSVIEMSVERLNELVFITHKLYQLGEKSVKLCKYCFSMNFSFVTDCEYCGKSEFDEVELTDEYVASAYNRFYCGDFASKSRNNLHILNMPEAWRNEFLLTFQVESY